VEVTALVSPNNIDEESSAEKYISKSASGTVSL
jgi:hypothetical protein